MRFDDDQGGLVLFCGKIEIKWARFVSSYRWGRACFMQ